MSQHRADGLEYRQLLLIIDIACPKLFQRVVPIMFRLYAVV